MPASSEAEVIPPEFSDDALALAFTAAHTETFRFTATENEWRRWDGTRWAVDQKLAIYDQIRANNREVARAAASPRLSTQLASGKTVNAVYGLVRTDPRHAVATEEWDRDPFLLNTPAGTVDLRTGELRAHRPEDLITRTTAVAPDLRGHCPTWERFLERVQPDAEVRAFLQRLAGYCLTGDTRVHGLFFAHGGGGNGKGTWLNTLSRILADYARTAPMEAFTATTGERHPTELAMLRGARLVTAQETEDGRRWAESRIKALTGGDPIAARFMRGDFFTYTPQFKLVIAGNHRPSFRSVDEAIRRRLYLIPFEQEIREDERDENLPERLRAEWSGILQWAIDGCLMWLESGLRAPEAVRLATDRYLQDEDSFGAWVEERCQRRPGAFTLSQELYTSWKRYADAAGEPAGQQKRFAERMQARGFSPKRKDYGRGYEGVALRDDEAQAQSGRDRAAGD